MDIKSLLKCLSDYNVRYVLFGATAMPIHGYTRATLDVDVFIDASDGNVQKTLAALTAFGYDMSDISLKDMQKTKILIRQYQLAVDIHPFVEGVIFDEVWKDRITGTYNYVPANFPSLDHTIQMKKAAGRPKDIED
ncbi:hypothetical protein KKA08_09775, partial [bacterium]|nr:hypothetical protein [bacterium]